MTSRNRVLTALSHKEPDRIPRDLGGTESSGLVALALHNLNKHLDIKGSVKVFEPYQYVAYPGDMLKKLFKIDTANLTPEPARWIERKNPSGFTVLLPEKWREEQDKDGSTVVRNDDGKIVARRPAGSHYFFSENPPLKNVSNPSQLSRYEKTIFSFDYPFFADESLDSMRKRSAEMHESGECVVFNLCCHILAAGQILRGYENFMVDLLSDKKLANTLLDLLMEGYLRRIDTLSPLLKDSVDLILLNDDLGTQNGPMLSPAVYREMIKPCQKKLFGHAKKSFGKPILMHSCGGMSEFIPDLIEIGVDALNPVQLSAAGMDIKYLKGVFGREIAFWGGGVDTQTVLNRKEPSEIEEYVLRNVEVLAKDGGFVFCQVHNIQPDVPPENIEAMYKALDRFSVRTGEKAERCGKERRDYDGQERKRLRMGDTRRGPAAPGKGKAERA